MKMIIVTVCTVGGKMNYYMGKKCEGTWRISNLFQNINKND